METIDDRNLAWKYQGNWHLEDNNSNLNLNSTTWTKDTKNATAEITFVGVQISIFGAIAPNGTGVVPKSSYIIDDGPISTFVGTQTDDFQFQKLFFKSGTLNPTNHTLVIKNLVQNGHLYIDFASVATPTVGATRSFPIIPPTSKLSSSSSTITGNSRTIYLLTYTSTDITSTGTTTPIATKLYAQPHKVSLYLWITIGVICVACLGFGILIVLRRRSARHKNSIFRITPFEVRPLGPFILMNEMRGCFTKARASFNLKHTINAISHPSGHSLSAAPPKYSGLD